MLSSRGDEDFGSETTCKTLNKHHGHVIFILKNIYWGHQINIISMLFIKKR